MFTVCWHVSAPERVLRSSLGSLLSSHQLPSNRTAAQMALSQLLKRGIFVSLSTLLLLQLFLALTAASGLFCSWLARWGRYLVIITLLCQALGLSIQSLHKGRSEGNSFSRYLASSSRVGRLRSAGCCSVRGQQCCLWTVGQSVPLAHIVPLGGLAVCLEYFSYEAQFIGMWEAEVPLCDLNAGPLSTTSQTVAVTTDSVALK